MTLYLLICFNILLPPLPNKEILLPIASFDRSNPNNIGLTKIGTFGLLRKARPNIIAHLHSGIDIIRPSNNYQNEPIHSISKGLVISKRDDGPYAQLIIEHEVNGRIFWTLYEHIAGISVNTGDFVDNQYPIARFMNEKELNNYGWQFNHFHFEILKKFPHKNKPTPQQPQWFFRSYTLECFTNEDLTRYFYNPLDYLSRNL